MPKKSRKKRVPKLKYTKTRGIGWHVSYRDPETGTPRRHRFGNVSREEAEAAYFDWVATHLRGEGAPPRTPSSKTRRKLDEQLAHAPGPSTGTDAEVLSGSLLHIASSFLTFEQSRVADESDRRRGSITLKTYNARKQFTQEFLKFINSRYEHGAVSRLELVDLKMEDVEAYNRLLVEAGYSSSQVTKRLQVVKAIIDRAGRPEHGRQLLTWNWDSRDVSHGTPATPRKLPTLRQLKLILSNCDSRKTAMMWLAIGCGFGQRDLAAIRVGQFDEISYDLRRSKTGVERYGDTPKLVWRSIQNYLAETERPNGKLLFLTRSGEPIVHGRTDTIVLWWSRLRKKLKEDGNGLGGFYTLRHLGATEFGSRPGCSIGAMRRWLGHSASSQMADIYMKPVSPESRPVVEWVRHSLKSGKADLRLSQTTTKQ